jgi:hypothetical protein
LISHEAAKDYQKPYEQKSIAQNDSRQMVPKIHLLEIQNFKAGKDNYLLLPITLKEVKSSREFY